MADPQLILKTTPPRVLRTALPRERLTQAWLALRDRTAISVSAPSGFGKTTLLTQWRRLWMEHGAIVAWATLDATDDPARFASLLLYALRMASGRPTFERIMAEYTDASAHSVDMLTGMLAEVAGLAAPTVLMLDDAERLPEETLHHSLAYLAFNAPPNLHIVIGSRGPLRVPTVALRAHGQFGSIDANDLRLDLFESVSMLEKRFGQRIALDDAVRLHEATDGWPLGLQLAATAIERAPDLHEAIASLSAREGDLERYFVESSFSQLPPAVGDFLIRIAILDDLSVDLAAAVTGCAETAQYLARLVTDSPMIVVGEQRDWMRIHSLGRDFLLGRFEKLSRDEQRAVHRRAGDWLAAHGHFHEAGRHALAAGDAGLARSYAKRCLFAIGAQGRIREAQAWLEQLPDEVLAGDNDLRLVAAWVLAIGVQPRRGLAIAEAVYASASATAAQQFVGVLVATAAAAFLDRPGVLRNWLDRVDEPPKTFATPVHEVSYANVCAWIELHAGATDRVRQLEAPYSLQPANESLSMAVALGRVIVALSHLWDGDLFKVDAILRSALVAAERQVGRRHVLAATFAAPLALVIYEQGDVAGARAMLANRLDVIEQTGLPDAIAIAYRVLAHVAMAQGNERGALETLGGLHELARTREMPRIALLALADQVRIHATHGRVETATALVGTIEALRAAFDESDFAVYGPIYAALLAISRAQVALARLDVDAADARLRDASAITLGLRDRGLQFVVRILQAVVAHERGLDATPLLRELLDLLDLGGFRRLVADTHPIAARLAQAIDHKAAPAPALTSTTARAATIPAGLLTPKEAEVLRLLVGGMSNKLIAKTMSISDETVKWHLKNLFSKLNAGTRKHAVDRARLLGLVAA